jgi:PAS domain S-box-containing protein
MDTQGEMAMDGASCPGRIPLGTGPGTGQDVQVPQGGQASWAFRSRLALQQRKLLLLGAALVAGYYLAFSALGVYPARALAVGLCIPLLFAGAAWLLPGASTRGASALLLAVTVGWSALGIVTAALAGGTACIGFHVIWALPLIYTLLIPDSFAACLAGAAVSTAGGLALMVRDGHGAAPVAQWLTIALAATAFALVRVGQSRGDLRTVQERERNAAALLASSEARYRLLADHSQDVVWTLDLESRRFTYVSPSITRQRGLTVAEAMAETLEQALTPESLARVAVVLGAVGTPREEDPHSGIYQQPCAGGSVKHVEVIASLVRDAQGRPFAVSGVTRDATARVEAEEAQRRSEAQVQQAQRLESVGRLAGGIAHDFNNLLTVILSCAHGLRRDLLEGRAASADEVGEIVAAGDRAADLTRQLLAFARRQPAAPVPLDLDLAVRSSERLLRRLLGEDLALRVRLEARPWAVRCDPGQLEQVILNLALNGRDAMAGGGTLAIETERRSGLPPGAGPGGDWVLLRVRDTGVGMAPEVRARLFEPFFTTKPPGKGTGLGLATVHGIVSQAGGQVHVESAPGQGATFEVWLPRCGVAATAPGRAGEAAGAGGTEEVLVVEDDPLVRAVTARILRGAGYRVRMAEDGAEALALVGRLDRPPGLVVTDVVMPGISGEQLAGALRQHHPALPVLFVSGYTRDALGDRDHLPARSAYLAKPYQPEALLSEVRSLLDAG